VLVIATAGHVDHGKSTLVRALTGMEPDRFAEEQRRGMTIDLGFAWTVLPDGLTVAFVDVPGHQRFVSTMLAGVGPVPAVLFVVAADEGWSAQSTEHLDALDALGVEHGLLVLTRSDIGDAELAQEEARTYLEGTSLAGVEAVAVSAVTGAGMDELRGALARLCSTVPPSPERRTRLWVDRVFSVRGSGTVITGTLTSGQVRVGDRLQVYPSDELVTVRGIEELKEAVPEAAAVGRVALNLRGVKPGALRRGDAVGGVAEWASTAEVDVRLRLGSASRGGAVPPVALPAELTLHAGSAAVSARVRVLGSDTVRLRLSRPLPLSVGEVCVLRDPGARRVVAGAVVLDPLPPPLRRRGAARERAAELVGVGGQPDLASEVHRRGAIRRSELVRIGVHGAASGVPPRAAAAGDWLLDLELLAQWRADLLTFVERWEAENPLQPGVPRQAAVRGLDLPHANLLDLVVRDVPELVLDRAGVRRAGRTVTLPEAVEAELQLVLDRLGQEPFDAPQSEELAAAGLTDRVLGVAVREGRLLRVSSGLYLLPTARDKALRRLRALPQPFTMAEAREALGTTRRVAVPLLEMLDREGHTRRVDTVHREVIR
jgi:selenocysteine-specific elongation factor